MPPCACRVTSPTAASPRAGRPSRSSPPAGSRSTATSSPTRRATSARTPRCSSTARPVEPEPHEVWAVNKPPGVVSTAASRARRKAVVELVESAARLYPVGRLDVDSTGLLLLTNDGELANRLTHPRYGVPKTYRATLRRPPAERDLRRLARGVELEDGITAPARVASPRRARGRDRDPRGPQPPGAEDDRGDRQRSRRAGASPLRRGRARRPRAGRQPSPRRRRGRPALGRCAPPSTRSR